MFTKKIVTSFVYLALFVLTCVSFFAPTQANACEVVGNGQTKFRTAYTTNAASQTQPEQFFQDDAPKPFVYVDVMTEGCTEGDVLYVSILGTNDNDSVPAIETEIFNYPIANSYLDNGFSLAVRAGDTTCGEFISPDCMLYGIVTSSLLSSDIQGSSIKYIIGNVIGGLINPSQAIEFAEIFGVSTTDITYGGSCVQYDSNGYVVSLGCNTSEEYPTIADYYNNLDLGIEFETTVNSTSTSKVVIPWLRYDCDGACELIGQTPWQTVSGGILPYGALHFDDGGPIQPSPLIESNYEIEYQPLAPLPFDGLNGGQTPTLGGYLAGLFRALIIITGVLSVIMIVVGGFEYIMSGAPGAKTDGRQKITNAIVGLLIALTSWLLLNTINKNLAKTISIEVPLVYLAGDADTFSPNNTSCGTGTCTAAVLPTDLGLECPGDGGSDAVPTIVDSFVNKVTYRFGAKGGNLPVGQQYPLTQGEQETGPYICSNNGQEVACRTFCPIDSVCLDCSGFVNHVRSCAGLSTFAGTSSMVSDSNAIAIYSDDISNDGTSVTINGELYTFKAGDLLVWNGHVLVYYGNGVVAESRGSMPGIKQPNYNIVKTSLNNHPRKGSITHLLKANP